MVAVGGTFVVLDNTYIYIVIYSIYELYCESGGGGIAAPANSCPCMYFVYVLSKSTLSGCYCITVVRQVLDVLGLCHCSALLGREIFSFHPFVRQRWLRLG